MHRTLLVTAAILLAAVPGNAAAPPTVADSLIPEYAASTDTRGLSILMRLQLEAERWQDAETTAVRLTEMYHRTSPERAFSMLFWRIYARARGYQAGGPSWSEALRRSFAELYETQTDKEVARTYGWFDANLDSLRETVARDEKACEGKPLDRCDKAADIIFSRQVVIVFEHMIPTMQPLLRADLERRFIVDDNLLIKTPEGAQIAAVLIRPRTASKQTSLLNFTIYARDSWAMNDAVEMAGNGYAGIVAFSRGKGRSPGPTSPYEHDGADAAAVIDWLAAQPWSDGRVGMFSGSYNASTQWGALKHKPRALKAIATHASNAPGIDTPMQGNVFQNFIYPWPLYVSDVPGTDDINYGVSERWSALNRKWYASGRPYRELPLIDGHANPIFEKWLDHPSYDSYWQRFIPVGREFADIDIPVFVATGYFDGGMVGALHYFWEHVKYRPNADHRMLIGPYHHFAMTAGVLPSVSGYKIDPTAVIDLRAVRLQWLDHVFRGAPLPDLLRDRVNFQVMGADRWRHVPTVEAMGVSRWRLHLGEASQDGRFLFSDRQRASAHVLSVDFSDRKDVDFQAPGPGLDVRNSLVFETPPLAHAMEIGGAFRGQLEIVTNKRDFDLSIGFYEQKADGTYLSLASYLGRASYMGDRTSRQLLQRGRRHVLKFESQYVTARQIAAGSRVVAVVGVPKQPEIQINYGTGRDVSSESIADAGEPLQLTFRPASYLELGVRRE